MSTSSRNSAMLLAAAAGLMAGALPTNARIATVDEARTVSVGSGHQTPSQPSGGFLSSMAKALMGTGGSYGKPHRDPSSPNKRAPGRNMIAIRAARKTRNVKRHRKACRA